MELNIDKDKCLCCNMCSDLCPEMFIMKNKRAVSRMSKVPENYIFPCKAILSQCPAEAITIEE